MLCHPWKYSAYVDVNCQWSDVIEILMERNSGEKNEVIYRCNIMKRFSQQKIFLLLTEVNAGSQKI